MEYIILILGCILIYILAFKRGYDFREEEARKQISKSIDKLEEDFIKTLVRVKLEKVEGTIFVYNADTNEFMAQGKNEDEIADILKSRFPGKRFAAAEENLKEVGLPHE